MRYVRRQAKVTLEGLLDILVSIDDRITKIDATHIDINGKFQVTYGRDVWDYIYAIVNEQRYTIAQVWFETTDTVTIDAWLDENSIIFTISFSYGAGTRVLNFAWINTDGTDYCLHGGMNDGLNTDFCTNTTLINIADGTVYSNAIPRLVNYTEGAGKIAYTTITPIVSGGVAIDYIPQFYGCSAVSRLSSIAMQDGKRYHAIGKNIMVEVDEEE